MKSIIENSYRIVGHQLIITTPTTFTDDHELPPHICRRYLSEYDVHVCFAVTTFIDAQCRKCGATDPLVLAYWPNNHEWRGVYCGHCDAVHHRMDELELDHSRYRVVFDYNYNLLALETRIHLRELMACTTQHTDVFCSYCRSTVTDHDTCASCHAYRLRLLLVRLVVFSTCRTHDVPVEVAVDIMFTYLQSR